VTKDVEIYCDYCERKSEAILESVLRDPGHDAKMECNVCYDVFSLFSDCHISDGLIMCPKCKKREDR
jgi:uncharacterized Zn finger protein